MEIPEMLEALDCYDGVELIHTRISKRHEKYYCHWLDQKVGKWIKYAMIEISNTNLDLLKQGKKDIRSLFDEPYCLMWIMTEDWSTDELSIESAKLDDFWFDLPEYGVFLK